MTDEELDARFTQLADAVTRVAEHQIQFQEQISRGQIRFQEQVGELAGFMRQMAERQDRHEQILEQLTETVEELRAANRRQERINDFLLRQQTDET